MNDPETCALCGAQKPTDTGRRHVDSGQEYKLYHCDACKGEWWDPLVNPGASWYEHDERYADRNHDPILDPNEKHRGVISYLGTATGRVLDVGCGTGNFLAYAESRGWKGWGIDFDADAIAAGSQALGLSRLTVADIHSFAKEQEPHSFDLVTFFDVLEHLDDHQSFMGTVEGLLVPNGKIAFSAPYRHGLRWLMPHDLPPRHLTRWDEESVRRFLDRNGYELCTFVRVPASVYFMALKFKFRYGMWSSLGLVKSVKGKSSSSEGSQSVSNSTVSFVQRVAKAKDLILFGIPALLLWTALLPFSARYTDFYAIARKR